MLSFQLSMLAQALFPWRPWHHTMAQSRNSGSNGHLAQKTCEHAILQWLRTFHNVNIEDEDFVNLADGDALHSTLGHISPDSVEAFEDRRGKELLIHIADQIGHRLMDHGINLSHNDLHDSASAAGDHDRHALLHIAELLLVLTVKGRDRDRHISEIQNLPEDIQGTLMQMIQRALADLQAGSKQARPRKSDHLRKAATQLEEENETLR